MLDRFRQDGRLALITGSSRGIGFAIAEALSRSGARVILHGRDPATLAAAVDQLHQAGGEAEFATADLGIEGGAQVLAASIVERFGRVDILVNNAGLNVRRRLSELTATDWNLVLRLDLSATVFLSQALAPAMTAARWGRIINVGSIMSLVARAGIPAYTAAKHGVAGLTKALAAELGSQGVTVNGIAPGYMETRGTEGLRSDIEFARMIERRTPVGRWGKPEDVAGAAVYLASDAASFVNGHLLVVDGGLTATI